MAAPTLGRPRGWHPPRTAPEEAEARPVTPQLDPFQGGASGKAHMCAQTRVCLARQERLLCATGPRDSRCSRLPRSQGRLRHRH